MYPTTHPSRRRWLAHAAVAATLGPLAAAAQTRPPGELRIGGTGAGLGPLQRLLESQPQVRFVPSLGTGGGLKALAAGMIDIALSARALGEAEVAQGLVAREFFRTPMVFAVHAQVPARQVTRGELAALYGGRTPNWSDGVPVRPVLRPQTDSDTRFVQSLGPAMAEAQELAAKRPGVLVAATDSDASEALERVAGSLGVSTLGLLRAEQRRVQVLDLDGVRPGLETLAAGRYPHVKTIWIVTRGSPGNEVQAALAALQSRKSQQTLAALGCTASGAA